METDPGVAAQPDAERSAGEVRGWTLEDASVIEVAGGDRQPAFFVSYAGSWLRCTDLEASMAAVWERTRRRAQLPPQWTIPRSEIVEAFERHWDRLRDLEPGRWWPPLAESSAAFAGAAGDGPDPSD